MLRADLLIAAATHDFVLQQELEAPGEAAQAVTPKNLSCQTQSFRAESICFSLLSTLYSLPFYSSDFSTFANETSVGVGRPKIDTITFSVCLSSFTSSTAPLKLANGPSVIRTCSPLANLSLSFGFSLVTSLRLSIAFTSASLSAFGWSPVCRKPVTRGVFFTTCQRSVSSAISTKT